jgi:hypothetical protein
MECDRDGKNAPSAMVEDHECIEEPEADRRHDEQIHRGDACGMVAQERLPALTRWRPASRHVLGHRRLCNLDAELQQLTVEAGGAPERIGKAHVANEASHLTRDGRPTATRTRLPAVAAENPIRAGAGLSIR